MVFAEEGASPQKATEASESSTGEGSLPASSTNATESSAAGAASRSESGAGIPLMISTSAGVGMLGRGKSGAGAIEPPIPLEKLDEIRIRHRDATKEKIKNMTTLAKPSTLMKFGTGAASGLMMGSTIVFLHTIFTLRGPGRWSGFWKRCWGTGE